MTTCPSGVDYMHLVEIARNHIEKTGKRSLKDRAVRKMLASDRAPPEAFPLGFEGGAPRAADGRRVPALRLAADSPP